MDKAWLDLLPWPELRTLGVALLVALLLKW
jgi:hypothetical protein